MSSSDRESEAVYAFISPVFVACGSVSLVLTWCMSLMYQWNPKVRGDHASTLIQLITVCEALYALKFVLSSAVYLGGLQRDRDSFHFINDNCATSVAYGQFLGTAAISWNACWMVDILVTLFLPLRNTVTLMPWYHLFSWGLATVTTAAVMAGAGHEGSDTHTCWLRGDAGLSYTFEAPLFCIMALALFSMVAVAWRLRAGGQATQRMRNGVLLRHLLYVAAFIFLWLFPIIHSFLDASGTGKLFSILDAIAVTSQAAVSASIRLSEPGAMRIFASTMRRLRNTLGAVVGLKPAFSPMKIPGEEELNEAPLSLLALLPCLCLRGGAGGARVGAELLPLLAAEDGTSSGVDGGGGGGGGGISEREVVVGGSIGSFFAPFLGGRRDGALEKGGLSTVHAGSPLLAHAYPVAGAHARLGHGVAAVTAAVVEGGGGVKGGGKTHAALTPLQIPLPGAASKRSGGAATIDSPLSPNSSGDGWADMSAELRSEIKMAMMNGLVQAIRASTGVLPSTVAPASATSATVLSPRPLSPTNSLGSNASDEDSGSESPSSEEEEGATTATTAAAPRGSSASASASARKSGGSARSKAVLARDLSTMIVQGPSAPTKRRGIGVLLKDPRTITRKFPGFQTGTITVSSLEEEVFKGIREAAGVEADYVFSQLNPVLLAEGKIKGSFSTGSSSSFFCRSLDDQLVVKTITSSEAEVLLRLLPAYTRHLRENPSTLLCRFYGAFSVSISSASRVFFVLMSNVFPLGGTPANAITFDLKGSTVNRRVRISKGEGGGLKYLWQDMEFREGLPRGVPLVDGEELYLGKDALYPPSLGGGSGGVNSSGGSSPSKTAAVSIGASAWGGYDKDLIAGSGRGRLLVDQLQRDVTLLASQGLMDYSLLLQIVPIESPPPSGTEDHHQHHRHQHHQHGEGGVLKFPPPTTPLTVGEAVSLVKAAGNPTYRSIHATPAARAAAAAAAATSTTSPSQSPKAAEIPQWSPLSVSLCALGVRKEGGGGGATATVAAPTSLSPPPDTANLGLSGGVEASGGGGGGGGGNPGGEPTSRSLDSTRGGGGKSSVVPFLGTSTRALLQVGVVDMLQYFDTSKRLENAYKSIRYGGLAAVGQEGVPADISAVDPNTYAVRFMQFSATVFQEGK